MDAEQGSRPLLTTIYTLTDPRTGLIGHVGVSRNPRKQTRTNLSLAKRGTPGALYDWLRDLQTRDLRPIIRTICAILPENAKSYIARYKKSLDPASIVPHRPRALSRAVKSPSDVRRALKSPHSPVPAPPEHVLFSSVPRSRYATWVMSQLRKYGFGSKRTKPPKPISATTHTNRDS